MEKVLYIILGVNTVIVGGIIFSHSSINLTFSPLAEANPYTVENEPVIEEEDKKNSNSRKFNNIQLLEFENVRNPFDISNERKDAYLRAEDAYKKRLEEEKAILEALKKEEEEKKKQEEEAQKEQNSTLTNPDANKGDNGTEDHGNAESQDNDSVTDIKENIIAKTEKIANQYKIDSTLLLAIIEEGNDYDVNLEKNVSGTTRYGLLQIRGDKVDFIMENLGVHYDKTQIKSATLNIEMGAWYIKYLLDKSNNDKDYALTSYYYGENQAKSLYSINNSYESDFSAKIKSKMSELLQ